MNLQPENIEAKGYAFLSKLSHEEVIPFVQEHLFKRNVFTLGFLFTNMLFLLWIICQWYLNSVSGLSFGGSFAHFCLGFLFSILLVPIHEYIHGLSYKAVGATKIVYTAHWKKFYFTAQADQFVANYTEFMKVAFAPFLVISFFCILLIFTFNDDQALIFISLLFWHTTMCGWDFALASFFYQYRKSGIITYDDFGNKETFFFIKTVKAENL